MAQKIEVEKLQNLIKDIQSCNKCQIESQTKNKTIGKGSKTPKVLFIGLNPGKDENECGIPFVGRSGQLLNKWINFLGLDNNTCAVVNLIKCFTPNESGLNGEEADNCFPFLLKQIELLKPDYIVTLGATVYKQLTGKVIPITSAEGNWYDSKIDGHKVFVMRHPSFFIRQGGYGWEESLKNLKDILNPQSIPEKVPVKEQDYVPLHCHTEYSIKDGAGKMKDNLQHAKDRGFNTVAITDHGTIAGWHEFQKVCDEIAIKPILGIEFYSTKDYSIKDRPSHHIVALAKDNIGLKNLFKLNTIANVEGFHYKPRITVEKIIEHKDGLIIMSACTGGLLSKRILDGEVQEAYDLAEKLKDEFGEDFYIELQPHNFDQQHITNPVLIEMANDLDIKTVITTDVHYKNIQRKDLHDAVIAIGRHKKYGEDSFTGDTHAFLTSDQLRAACKVLKVPPEVVEKSFVNTKEIAKRCNARLEKYDTIIPDFEVPEDFEV